VSDSSHVSQITFQELIRTAEKSSQRETDLSMDLRIEIRTHGKPVHLWKIALRLARHVMVTFGKDAVVFFTLGNDELVDTMKDDDGEYWHALDWRQAGVGELGG
jgi:hypothetical protein